MKARLLVAGLLALAASQPMKAQSELYPKHFDLEQVELLDGPMKTAMDLNIKVLLQYDTYRLLTPFVRQAGLHNTTDTKSPYYQWLTKHPNFKNWGGDAGFDLSGHVGGHYLSALALAYAACHDAETRQLLKQRLDYMLGVMKDCQDQYDNDTEGLYGFIGGQPINDSWKKLYKGDLSGIRNNWGWVPFYCQHKILAGLRDAYLYGGSEEAKEMFRKLSDWSVNLVKKVSDTDFQGFLDCEHGGMNESMLDAYQLFGDQKYLNAARKYTHKSMLNGMQTLNTTFLDGKHANTQVPKYIGMERIGEISTQTDARMYRTAAENFWKDVAMNRTVCIGGNSVNEHFLAAANSNRYIDQPDGPESCNSNNMLKLSEMMADRTGDSKYADFYESTMWNHILSTQDPTTGGYVYFTTLRPQGYRIYSVPNKGMWCCVGTGMENHSKYGHFIYTHDGAKTLYVNLFTASKLESDDFVVTQETNFPYEMQSKLTVGKAGQYAIAVRHPSWTTDGFFVSVNGEKVVNSNEEKGYVILNRQWAVGDIVTIHMPAELRYEECPNYGDYIAFKYGPILLGANVSPKGETLQNEYGGEGRMDHSPGAMGRQMNLLSAPLLIGARSDVLSRIKADDLSKLTFTIDAKREGVETYKWGTLTLQPFYEIHHARYMCYWYQQTPENFAKSDMAQTEAANEALLARTLDFVAPGEQQSEAGHEYNYSSDSSKGSYNGESYRDAKAGGYVEYALFNKDGVANGLAIMCRFTTADKGRKASLLVDGTKIADIEIPASIKSAESNGFYNIEYPIPATLVKDKDGKVKTKFVVRLSANKGTLNPGLYYLRLTKDYQAPDPTADAYQFKATDWTTGDANRVSAANITYDTEKNIIHVNAGTGANNVALMMKYEELDYTIDKQQKYLVVRGTNLKTTSGASYLWWLNGANRGSQVPPTTTKTLTLDGLQQQVFAWDMTTSGLYDNFADERPSVCAGMTIFGLTSTTGHSDIYDINFVADANSYMDWLTGIRSHKQQNRQPQVTYNLQGMRTEPDAKGIHISGGRKIVVK